MRHSSGVLNPTGERPAGVYRARASPLQRIAECGPGCSVVWGAGGERPPATRFGPPPGVGSPRCLRARRALLYAAAQYRSHTLRHRFRLTHSTLRSCSDVQHCC